MEKTLKYLKEILGSNLVINKNKKVNMPMYITENYYLDYVDLYNESYVLVKNISDKDINLSFLRKQINQIQNFTKCIPIFIFENLRLSKRNCLIKENIPFVVPNNQIFIPTFIVNLKEKEYFPNEYGEKFSVAAQVVYIYLLLNDIKEVNAPQLVNKIPYSKITFNRALKELENRNLFYVKGNNTRKVYKILNKKEFWENGKNFLVNPIDKVYYVNSKTNHSNYLMSNETALARLGTMLNEPRTRYYATTKEKIKHLNNDDIINKYDIINDNYYIIEQFKYNPSFLSKNNYIDIISLYAELKDHKEERIQIALDELVEGELFDNY